MEIKEKYKKVIDLCVQKEALAVCKTKPDTITFELVRVLTTDYTPAHSGFPYQLPFILGS